VGYTSFIVLLVGYRCTFGGLHNFYRTSGGLSLYFWWVIQVSSCFWWIIVVLLVGPQKSLRTSGGLRCKMLAKCSLTFGDYKFIPALAEWAPAPRDLLAASPDWPTHNSHSRLDLASSMKARLVLSGMPPGF
jgi:hypothetical protein